MSENEILSFDTKELAKVKSVPTFNLVKETSKILSKRIPEFDFVNPPVDPNELASSLVETCIANRGLGLSANQCGLPYRVFVAGYGEEYVAYFNPEITSTNIEEEIGYEGCLSFPHLFLNINRPKSVNVRYQDFKGEYHTTHFEGLTARVFLHEYDHMEGITFLSRAKPLALKTGMDKRSKLFHKLEKAQKQLSKMAKGRR
jgi:peptide deformylase